MNDPKLLDAVERYIHGEMSPEERLQFENLRNTSSELDQLVVEHTLFLQQLDQFGQRKQFKSSLNEVHNSLSEQGHIESMKMTGRAKVAYLWKRYKRVAAIAATIAGFTALTVSALVSAFTPKNESSKVTELVSKVNELDQKTKKLEQDNKIKESDKKNNRPVINTPVRFNGTGFMIDVKGYLVTNAHVVKNSRNIFIQNNKGDQYKVTVVKLDLGRDIAILKIDDSEFKPMGNLPYGIRKSSTDIAEPLFTLGFPRNEIVYGEGYLSARTGNNGDTLSCQITVAANPGNSGGPVFNQNGEVIGILSTKEIQTEGAVFAIQSKYIYQVMDDLKKDTAYKSVKLSANSSIKGIKVQQQVMKIQDYVFMVKGD